MSCSTAIKEFIELLPVGRWFATRECLNFGSRGAVDMALMRLVSSGYLIRLARGIFAVSAHGEAEYDPFKIAVTKAMAFAKCVSVHGKVMAQQLGLLPEDQEPLTYCVHGVTSSFESIDRLIRLKSFSARKVILGDSKVGQTIRSLWLLGQKGCDHLSVEVAKAALTSAESEELRYSAHRMPGWLMKLVRETDCGNSTP